jgi:hypothetical protein
MRLINNIGMVLFITGLIVACSAAEAQELFWLALDRNAGLPTHGSRRADGDMALTRYFLCTDGSRVTGGCCLKINHSHSHSHLNRGEVRKPQTPTGGVCLC